RNHVNKKLSAYLHGELDQEESRRVAEHMLACRRCRDEYEEIKFGARLAGRLSQLEEEKAPAELVGGLEAALDKMASPANRSRIGVKASRSRAFWSLPASRFGRFGRLGAAATLLLMIGLSVFWYQARKGPRPSWDVTRIEGAPKIGSKVVGDAGKLSVGEWLVTDDSSRAEIHVGEIGQVQVDPGSRVRLLEAKADEHRLALERGKM